MPMLAQYAPNDEGLIFAQVWMVTFFVGLIAVYFLPTILALVRGHKSVGGIIVINVLLGWIVVGWIVALVWSLSNSQPHRIVIEHRRGPRRRGSRVREDS